VLDSLCICTFESGHETVMFLQLSTKFSEGRCYMIVLFVSTRKVDTIAVEFVSNYHVMFVSNYHVMFRDGPGRYSAKNHRKPNRITTVTSFRNQLQPIRITECNTCHLRQKVSACKKKWFMHMFNTVEKEVLNLTVFQNCI